MQPVMQFKSHIEGKNADVTIWPDRIEWQQQGKLTMTRLMASPLTGGKVALRKGSDTNMIPIRAVQGVATHKGGIGYTNVEVTTGGDKIAFRVSKDKAEQVKAAISRLMLEV